MSNQNTKTWNAWNKYLVDHTLEDGETYEVLLENNSTTFATYDAHNESYFSPYLWIVEGVVKFGTYERNIDYSIKDLVIGWREKKND